MRKVRWNLEKLLLDAGISGKRRSATMSYLNKLSHGNSANIELACIPTVEYSLNCELSGPALVNDISALTPRCCPWGQQHVRGTKGYNHR